MITKQAYLTNFRLLKLHKCEHLLHFLSIKHSVIN